MLDKEVKKIHQTSIHRAQAIRLFHFIQQNANQPRNIMNASILTQFFNKIFNNNVSNYVIDFLHKIDKQGRQMNEQYWGYCISDLLQDVDVHSDVDINNIHYTLKNLLNGSILKPFHRYLNWDKLQYQTVQQKQAYYELIFKTCGQLGNYINVKIDIGTFQLLISKLNCCFSLISLDPSKQNEIIEIYQKLLTINIVELLQYALTLNIQQNQLLDQFLKMLCFLYSGFKYKQIKEILQRTFLNELTNKWAFMRSIQDKRSNVRYFTSVLAALISHYDKNFSRFILTKNQYLVYMCKNIGTLSQIDGIYYSLQFLINLISNFSQIQQEWQIKNRDIVANIYNFALSVLQMSNVKFQTLAACLRLIAQCIKAIDFSPTQLRSLKIVSNVFQSCQNQLLIAATLCIYRNAFLKDHLNTKQSLLGQKQFDTYFKKCLGHNHPKQHMSYMVLQIMLLLSHQSNIKYLFQKNLIQHIFNLRFNQVIDGSTMFFISEILLNFVINSLQTQWMLTYLYDKKLLQTIGVLLTFTQTQDQVILNHYPIESKFLQRNKRNVYFNKQVFINCLKSLYFLTAFIDNAKHKSTDLKKRQLYRKVKKQLIQNFTSDFINNFLIGIKNYIKLPENFLKISLKQQIILTIQDYTKYFKIYKLISFVIQQMTIHLRSYCVDLSVLKKINNIRNQFHLKMYYLMSLHELQVQRIPVYVRLNVQVQGQQSVIKRVPKLNWQQFNSFLNQIVYKNTGFDATYQIKQCYTNRMIATQGDYRNILDHILHNFKQSNFTMFLKIFEIRKISQSRQFSQHNSVRLGQLQMSRSRVQYPRFMSMKMPTNRDMSPYSSRKGMGRSQRQPSPNFGSLCTQCRRNTTLNASRICNECIQNSDFK